MSGPPRPLGAAVDAVARSLGTAAEGRRFVEAVAERLAERGLMEIAGGARSLLLRDRERPQLLVWPPLLVMAPLPERLLLPDVQLPGGTPPEVSHVSLELEAAPVGEAVPASLSLGQGHERLELVYDERGRLREVLPGAAGGLALLQRADLQGKPSTLELARLLLESIGADPRGLRVRAVPTSAEGAAVAAAHGLVQLRRALFEGVGDEDRVVVAVALEGGTAAGAATRGEALARVDDDVPAVLLDLAPLPTRIPGAFWEAGFHRWVRVVGDAGDVTHTLVRDAASQVTLIGEEVLGHVEPWRLDEELDAVDRTTRGVLAAVPGARAAVGMSTLTTYRVVDDARRRRVPIELSTSQSAPDLGPWELTRPDELAWQVARWRRRK